VPSVIKLCVIYADCHNSGHYTVCHYVVLNMPNDVIVNVVAPFVEPKTRPGLSPVNYNS
jgi:hypothetical protein